LTKKLNEFLDSGKNIFDLPNQDTTVLFKENYNLIKDDDALMNKFKSKIIEQNK
jgi:hypothetical protein